MSTQDNVRSIVMSKTWILFPISVVAAACLVAWNHSTMDRVNPNSSAFTSTTKLTEFTESFVHVTLFLEQDGQRQPVLRATFKPTETGFHLYSKDLPEAGIKGIGVPTRLDLPQQSGIAPSGPLFTDVSPQDARIDVLDVRLPVYPEGSVTLRQPITLSPKEGGFSAQCTVSYMSCQMNGTCRFPVKHKLVQFEIPKGT
jgi:hypothetical protein